MQLSAYILTFNSERYLDQILSQTERFADETVIVDSGSTDATLAIASRHPSAIVHHRPLDNFKDQRNFAASVCSHDWVFFADSDELPDDRLVAALQQWKAQAAPPPTTAWAVERRWFVMGRQVHNIYPVECPDRPVRLFNRRQASFGSGSNLVHETLGGHSEVRLLDGRLDHHTFHTREELDRKVGQYTDLAALDLMKRRGRPSALKTLLDPPAAFVKWYITKRGFLDGRVGLVLGAYAYRYTRQKYRKARRLPPPSGQA